LFTHPFIFVARTGKDMIMCKKVRVHWNLLKNIKTRRIRGRILQECFVLSYPIMKVTQLMLSSLKI
jgi:hypothetical protein